MIRIRPTAYMKRVVNIKYPKQFPVKMNNLIRYINHRSMHTYNSPKNDNNNDNDYPIFATMFILVYFIQFSD